MSMTKRFIRRTKEKLSRSHSTCRTGACMFMESQ
jgi:hypothetical protein